MAASMRSVSASTSRPASVSSMPSLRALDQRQACQGLQVSKLERDRGLREMQLLRRGGDRPVLVNRGQRPQLADGQLPQKPACHGLPHIRKTLLYQKITKFP